MPTELTVLTADYCQRQSWSGIGVAAAIQAKALAARGCLVDVLSPSMETPPRPTVNPRLHVLPRERFPLSPQRGALLHLHSLGQAQLAHELVRRFRLRLVYTAHALPHRELPDSARAHHWSAVQDCIFAHADRVVFLNESDQADACHRIPGLGTRSCVLPNPIPRAQPAASGHRENLVLFVGRIAASKGIALFAATVAGLLDRGCSWNFTVAGGHGDAADYEMLTGLATRYHRRCHLLGWLDRPAMHALYARASLVLIPSSYEPCGMVALEAMRMGVPVLASGAGGLARLADLESGAQIVGDNSPQSWIEACERLIASDTLRRELSLRGPAYVTVHCDPQRWAGRFLAAVEH